MTDAEREHVVAVLLDELRVRTTVNVEGVTDALNVLIIEEFIGWWDTEVQQAVDLARQPDGDLSPFILDSALTQSLLCHYRRRFGEPPLEGLY